MSRIARGWQTLPGKGQWAYILGFFLLSFAIGTQKQPWEYYTNGHGHVKTKLYLQKQMGRDMGHGSVFVSFSSRMSLTLEQHELELPASIHMQILSINTYNIILLIYFAYDFLSNIFSLAYFTVRTQYIIHITYKYMLIDCLRYQ